MAKKESKNLHYEKFTPGMCLNLGTVRNEMKRQRMTRKALAEKIGMKDPHTLTHYFDHPDKIRLSHITKIADALKMPQIRYDELIIRIDTEDDFKDLVSGRSDPLY